MNDFDIPLGKDLPYAPEIFGKAGYATAAFVGSIILDPGARFAPGFERGFQTYDAGFHRRLPGEDSYKAIERRADEVVAHAVTWLQGHKNQRFFLWVHLYDAHDPYDPPEPYQESLSISTLRRRDRIPRFSSGSVVVAAEENGRYENTLIAVMADHGEGLGDHGEMSHGIFLYDETIHVPLLVKLPHNHSRAKRIDKFVELVDVLPTILQASGVAVPAKCKGV